MNIQDRKLDFITAAAALHNQKYCYSKISYINNHTKVTMICPVHGDFQQFPNDHLSGCGCPQCGNEAKATKRRKSQSQFTEEANLIHNNQYEYGKVNYKNSNTNIIIVCPIHGDFQQLPLNHLKGHGCPSCGYVSTSRLLTIRGGAYQQISGKYWNRIVYIAGKRNLPITISVEYAWSLFNGKCALSGRPIRFRELRQQFQTASLDRIDSTKGYIEGNVQWIHKDFQNFKMNRSEKEFVGMCKEIVNNLCQ